MEWDACPSVPVKSDLCSGSKVMASDQCISGPLNKLLVIDTAVEWLVIVPNSVVSLFGSTFRSE